MLLEHNYNKALNLYNESLKYALNINHNEIINIYNNLSLVFLKLENYKNSKNNANLAYNINNNNIKALYRLLLANFKLTNYDEAIKYGEKLLIVEPNNVNAKKLINDCIYKKNENLNKQKQFYKKMFI